MIGNRETGDRIQRNAHLVAHLKNSLACLLLSLGRYAKAREILTEALTLISRTEDVLLASMFLETKANAELGCGDPESADRMWIEALSMSRDLGDQANAICCLGGLSRTAAARDDHSRAVRLAAAHSRLSAEWSVSDQPYWLDQLGRSRVASRAKLGPTRFDEAWNEGLDLSLERATDYALRKPVAATSDAGPLSRRELEVAKLVAGGMTNREIGRRLFISERTAEGHLERIRSKLNLRSRSQVAAWAAEHGLTSAQPRKEREEPV